MRPAGSCTPGRVESGMGLDPAVSLANLPHLTHTVASRHSRTTINGANQGLSSTHHRCKKYPELTEKRTYMTVASCDSVL